MNILIVHISSHRLALAEPLICSLELDLLSRLAQVDGGPETDGAVVGTVGVRLWAQLFAAATLGRCEPERERREADGEPEGGVLVEVERERPRAPIDHHADHVAVREADAAPDASRGRVVLVHAIRAIRVPTLQPQVSVLEA